MNDGRTISLSQYLSETTGTVHWISPLGHRGSREHLLQLPDSYLPRTGSQYIADIGCGNGTLSELLGDRYPDSIILGSDLSRNILPAASSDQALSQNTAYIQGSGAAYVQDSSLDMLYAINMVQAVDEPGGIVTESLQATRPDRYVAVTLPVDGAEQFLTGAAEQSDAIIDRYGASTEITAGPAETLIRTQSDRTTIQTVRDISEEPVDAERVVVQQNTFSADWMDSQLNGLGEIVAERDLPCDPRGLPALLSFFGFEAVEAESLVSAYIKDELADPELLPSVRLYVVRRTK